MSATPPLAPIRSQRRLRLLDDGQLADLRAGTLEILETIGVDRPSEAVRRCYEAHGASVDHAARRVQFSPDLVVRGEVDRACSYVMAGREAEFDLLTDGSAFYVATDGRVDPRGGCRCGGAPLAPLGRGGLCARGRCAAGAGLLLGRSCPPRTIRYDGAAPSSSWRASRTRARRPERDDRRARDGAPRRGDGDDPRGDLLAGVRALRPSPR
ncbi:MAG: hypothetical protein U0838_09930 [Chloroflexota bacterium]